MIFSHWSTEKSFAPITTWGPIMFSRCPISAYCTIITCYIARHWSSPATCPSPITTRTTGIRNMLWRLQQMCGIWTDARFIWGMCLSYLIIYCEKRKEKTKMRKLCLLWYQWDLVSSTEQLTYSTHGKHSRWTFLSSFNWNM